MSLPKAVTSSTKTPGIYLLINLLAGPANPGSSVLRALLIAQKNTADGDIAVDSEVRKCFGGDDVLRALGEGSPGHLAALQMFLAFGALSLDVVAPAPNGAGVATVNEYTITGAPTSNMQFMFDVKGVQIGPVGWAVGESITVFRARAIAAINAVRPLPMLAGAGGTTPKLALTAKSPGPWGNDVTCGVTVLSGSGGAVSSSVQLTAGSGEFTIAVALSKVQVTEYAAIGLATSNADAANAASNSNAELLQLHIEAYKVGLNASLQYAFIGHTGSIANVEAGAAGRNAVDMTYAFLMNGQSLPAEVMGWELGDSMRWYQTRANYNRIGNPAPYLIGSRDPQADSLTANEVEDLLNHGVAPYNFTANSTTNIALVSPITTYSLDPLGNPDFRCYYQTDVWGMNAIMRGLRSSLPAEFPNCSITEDLPPGSDTLPPGVVERKDVANFCYSDLRGWASRGVANKVYLEQVIEDGSFAIEIDEDDESQVNIFIPSRIVKPLAKFSVVAHKTG